MLSSEPELFLWPWTLTDIIFYLAGYRKHVAKPPFLGKVCPVAQKAGKITELYSACLCNAHPCTHTSWSHLNFNFWIHMINLFILQNYQQGNNRRLTSRSAGWVQKESIPMKSLYSKQNGKVQDDQLLKRTWKVTNSGQMWTTKHIPQCPTVFSSSKKIVRCSDVLDASTRLETNLQDLLGFCI